MAFHGGQPLSLSLRSSLNLPSNGSWEKSNNLQRSHSSSSIKLLRKTHWTQLPLILSHKPTSCACCLIIWRLWNNGSIRLKRCSKSPTITFSRTWRSRHLTKSSPSSASSTPTLRSRRRAPCSPPSRDHQHRLSPPPRPSRNLSSKLFSTRSSVARFSSRDSRTRVWADSREIQPSLMKLMRGSLESKSLRSFSRTPISMNRTWKLLKVPSETLELALKS